MYFEIAEHIIKIENLYPFIEEYCRGYTIAPVDKADVTVSVTQSDIESGLIRSNKTAAFIVDQLKSETTLDSIVDAMFEKYDAPKEVLRRDAQAVIDKLRSVGAIDEQIVEVVAVILVIVVGAIDEQHNI